MNKPSRPEPPFATASPPYELDGYGWAMAQARLIREHRIDEIDWDNVAEEIESVGRSEWRSVQSALRVVILHQLKWRHQVTFRCRSWSQSIDEHLRRFDHEVSENPGLKPHLDQIKAEAHRRARNEAAQETGLDLALFPVDPPSWDDIRAPLED